MSDEDVYYYTGDTPLVIVTKWHADKLGGPAITETTIILTKGQAIDLSVLQLVRRRPS